MAKKKKQQKLVTQIKSPQVNNDSDRIAKFESDFNVCDGAIATLRDEWREHENIFYNLEKGEAAADSKSNVNDGHLSTSIIQRTQRVAAQPATGKVDYLDVKDQGKNMLLNLVLQKYIIPNSNTQYSHSMKLKLASIRSQIYGDQECLVDYVVSDNYVGPDFWLIPKDHYYPQPGVFQPGEMDYCYVDELKTIGYLKSLPKGKESKWKNIDELIAKVKEKKEKIVYKYQTANESKYSEGFEGVLLRTRFEREKWITYAPDYSELGILREIDNPHKNHKLPIVVKHTLPLLDRATGWSDTERGMPLQLTINSLLNLGLDSARYTLFPITIYTQNQVVKSSMKYGVGSFWEEITPGSIRPLSVNPQGINTFNSMSGYSISALNNMLGTSDLSSSKVVDDNLGKTPQALKMQQARESAADTWERQTIEEFTQELYDRFIDLIAVNQPKPIDINMMVGEVEQIAKVYPDVVEMFDKVNGRLRIKPNSLAGKYRFFIDSGSTVQKDTIQENQALTGVLQMIMSNPQVIQSMNQKGKDIDFAELVNRWIVTTGIKDADKIVTDFKPQVAPQVQGMPPMSPDMANMAQNPNLGGTEMPLEQPQVMPNEQSVAPQAQNYQFNDPQINQLAQMLMGGAR